MDSQYYHVGIFKKTGQKAYEVDLSEAQLIERIVNPIKKKQDFMCGNSIVMYSEIDKVMIRFTNEPSSSVRGAKFERELDRWFGNIEKLKPLAHYVIRRGTDVTKGYLDSLPISIDDHKIERPLLSQTNYSEIFPGKQFALDEKLCFVLMPFDEKHKPVYEQVIKPVVVALSLNARRADDIFRPDSIMNGIWEHINKARVIVADLSDRNPNVFYEVGLSHALRKDVVLITKRIEDVPFDLRHLRCIVYEDTLLGAKKLERVLTEALKEILSSGASTQY